MTTPFKLVTELKPQGDQPEAIKKLSENFLKGRKEQVLLGVTGSGKTFTMAHVIRRIGIPALVISHNKTLAAQLYSEFKELFPENAVEYFVSYYDYYQPEAYIPRTDTYIEKDAAINDDLDRLRLAATSSLLSRDDVIVVSSVSCIYGLGAPEDWAKLLVRVSVGERRDRDEVLRELVAIQYVRDDAWPSAGRAPGRTSPRGQRGDRQFKRGSIRVRGDTVDVFPSYHEEPIRLEWNGEKLVRIALFDRETGKQIRALSQAAVYPAKHFVTTSERLSSAMEAIRQELAGRVKELISEGKDLEARRLESRTNYDLEMMREMGYCPGIENYSRHFSGRRAGDAPYTLIDYFPKNFLVIIDESHQSIPQIRGMYNGDRSRKLILVEHGFRLPSALDNRPLNFPEFDRLLDKALYVSATPDEYEMQRAQAVVEQIIRPTGLVDPEVDVRPTEGQIDDLMTEIRKRAKLRERVLVTTLTKRMAEDLSRYLKEAGIKVTYLHSEVETIDRVEILRDLRFGKFDCLVGINLLREGLDLPEVSLVAILDADKEGFLRNDISLIQTAGRAARHINGRVIMYADEMTDSMKRMIGETARRRKIQLAFNQEHSITPKSVEKAIRAGIEQVRSAEEFVAKVVGEKKSEHDVKSYLAYLTSRMEEAASRLDFEKAARFRDEIRDLEKKLHPP
ncbi:MAG: excinuclease ABC subunit UvrB [Candidatus Omnitrophica bacterium]|nr:excinuclease ABC subunit UvrB [Candidatus Omnitrophota bacterium]